jgi:hypothetical protein
MDDECCCGCVDGEQCSRISEFLIVAETYENVQLVVVEGGLSICRNRNRIVEIEDGISIYGDHEIDAQIIEIGKESYLIIAILIDYYTNGDEKKIITELFSRDFDEGIYYYGFRFTVDEFLEYIGKEKINGHTVVIRDCEFINLFIENKWTAEINLNSLKTLVLTEMPGYDSCGNGRIIFGHNSSYTSFALKHMYPLQNKHYI